MNQIIHYIIFHLYVRHTPIYIHIFISDPVEKFPDTLSSGTEG